jgi:hypothetical protein
VKTGREGEGEGGRKGGDGRGRGGKGREKRSSDFRGEVCSIASGGIDAPDCDACITK